jgi:hypothetical protein
MAQNSRLEIAVIVFGLALPIGAIAQSDGGSSLGDLARSLRTKKIVASAPVIDNDNLNQVMDRAETNRTNGTLEFAIEPSGKDFQVTSPDATCSLSFNANASAILAVPVVPIALPAEDLAKVDGPAVLDSDTLQISVHNGSEWTLREITVGLTIVRVEPDEHDSLVRLLPASEDIPPTISQKRSDKTLLLHLKGTAAPDETKVFVTKLNNLLAPDQDWHWSIVEAKGIPSNTPSPAPSYFGGQ